MALLPVLSACTSVTLADHQVCGSMGTLGAHCDCIFSSCPQDMTLEQFGAYWTNLQDPKVAMEVSALTEWKSDIEQLCSYTNDCSQTTEAQVDALYQKISAAQTTATKAAHGTPAKSN